ncbi:hypothetical protein HDV05_001539, partial [Chytridiales sp. JEL 0842]
MWKKKEIANLSNASVVDLKAELFKTKEEFEKSKKLADSMGGATSVSTKVFK